MWDLETIVRKNNEAAARAVAKPVQPEVSKESEGEVIQLPARGHCAACSVSPRKVG